MTQALPVLLGALLLAGAAGAPPRKPVLPEDAVRVRITERKLEEWKIQKVEFREATIDQVLDFLKSEARKLDPEQRGLNFVLSPAAATGAKVTLTLDEVPFGVALRYAVEAAGLEFRVEPFVIVIDKPPAAPPN